MKTTLKIAIACFIGAAMGTLISFELNQMLWWLGAIAGGIIGYLIYDIEVVIKAVPKAWKATGNWKPEPNFKKGLLLYLSLVFIFILNGLICFVIISKGFNYNYICLPFLAFIYCMTALLLLMFLAAVFIIGLDEEENTFIHLYEDNESKKLFINLLKYTNPILLPFAAILVFLCVLYFGLRLIYKNLGKTISSIKNIALICGAFLKNLFILIHSQARLICGVDSLIGAVLGHFFFHNSIMGGIAGAALGVINYWIISIRILKLEPKL